MATSLSVLFLSIAFLVSLIYDRKMADRVKNLEEAVTLYGRILRQHESAMRTQSEIQNGIIDNILALNKEIRHGREHQETCTEHAE